ncbi:hypothetical protein [Candidatus Rhabdochlamydia sp. W815]|nr:hypothetical protein [Candidatus Rhabdochlamydia sp. W815]
MTRYRSEIRDTFVTFTFTLLSVDPIYAELKGDSRKESKEFEKNNPPPIPWATHPSGRAISNPLYKLASQRVTKEKSLLKKIMGFFHKCFARKSCPIPQARYTLHAFDSGFECDAESENFTRPLNVSRNKDPIYTEIKNSKKRNPQSLFKIFSKVEQ